MRIQFWLIVVFLTLGSAVGIWLVAHGVYGIMIRPERRPASRPPFRKDGPPRRRKTMASVRPNRQ